jgi:hypothetical protein
MKSEIVKPDPLALKFLTGAEDMFWKRSEQYQNITVSDLSGSSGEVAISLFNIPIHHSASDQIDYLADSNIGPFIIEEIFQTGVNFAAIKGFRHVSYYCFNCSKEINISGSRPETFEFMLTYKKFPPFTVKIKLPAVICLNCGSLNGVIMKGKDVDVVQAVENAFRSKGVEIKK